MIKLSKYVLNNFKIVSDIVQPIFSYEGEKNTLNAWSSLERIPFCSHNVVMSSNTTLVPVTTLFFSRNIHTYTILVCVGQGKSGVWHSVLFIQYRLRFLVFASFVSLRLNIFFV
jgi:hypothetical protein